MYNCFLWVFVVVLPLLYMLALICWLPAASSVSSAGFWGVLYCCFGFGWLGVLYETFWVWVCGWRSGCFDFAVLVRHLIAGFDAGCVFNAYELADGYCCVTICWGMGCVTWWFG